MNETSSNPSRRRIPTRVAAALLLLAVFAVGLIAGFALDRVIHWRHFGFHRWGRGPVPVWALSEGQQRRHWSRLSARLHLSPEQKTAVDSILTRRTRQLEETRARFEPAIHAVMEDARRQIDSVLTPDQRARLEKFRREHRRGERR
jgi:Spy/CpxP family protein refolding chaperone